MVFSFFFQAQHLKETSDQSFFFPCYILLAKFNLNESIAR